MAERPLLRSDDAFSLQDYAVMPGDSQKTPLLDSSIDEQSFPGDDGGDEAEQIMGEMPTDKYNAGYLLFFLQGFGCLFPWNAFITVQLYWSSRLKKSDFSDQFANYFSFGFQFANISMLYLSNRYQNSLPLESRILYPMILQFLIFCAITAMVRVEFGDENVFFFITQALVMLSAACTSFYQGGLFGLGGMLPFKYTQALMAGQGLGGIIVALLSIITTAVYPDSETSVPGAPFKPDDSAFLFFICAVIVTGSCCLAVPVLFKLKFVRHKRATVALSVKRASQANLRNSASIQDQAKTLCVGDRPWSTIAPMAFMVGYIFFVTLAVFPSIAVKVSAPNPDNTYGKNYFLLVYCFLGFNVGDYIGRVLAGLFQWPALVDRVRLWFPVMLRTAFIPLFMMCTSSAHIPTVEFFHEPWFPYVLMLLLGTTNGYFSTILLMYAPGLVREEHREWAGSTMLFCLVSGLACGSFFSFAISAVLCHCNPFISAATNSTNSTYFSDFGPSSALLGGYPRLYN